MRVPLDGVNSCILILILIGCIFYGMVCFNYTADAEETSDLKSFKYSLLLRVFFFVNFRKLNCRSMILEKLMESSFQIPIF